MKASKAGPFIIGFNGPPKSGKDAVATALADLLDSEGVTNFPIHKLALAETMRAGCAALLGLTLSDTQYAEIKDQMLPILDRKDQAAETFRQFMIHASEDFIKPIYGGDFWSRLMHHRNRTWWGKHPSILLVTDIGFPDEVEYFCNNSSFYLNVVLTRKNASYEGDSRKTCWVPDEYIRDGKGVNFCLTNDDTLEEAAKEVARIMYKFGLPVF